MSKNVLLIILLGIFLMVVTGCDNNEQRTDNTSNMNEEQDVSVMMILYQWMKLMVKIHRMIIM